MTHSSTLVIDDGVARAASHAARSPGYSAGLWRFCMGAALVRLEARIAFEELLTCMPEFEVLEQPERIRSVGAWGFESVKGAFKMP